MVATKYNSSSHLSPRKLENSYYLSFDVVPVRFSFLKVGDELSETQTTFGFFARF
jgi:hypothetical protein